MGGGERVLAVSIELLFGQQEPERAGRGWSIQRNRQKSDPKTGVSIPSPQPPIQLGQFEGIRLLVWQFRPRESVPSQTARPFPDLQISRVVFKLRQQGLLLSEQGVLDSSPRGHHSIKDKSSNDQRGIDVTENEFARLDCLGGRRGRSGNRHRETFERLFEWLSSWLISTLLP